jgi:hypothetical protein
MKKITLIGATFPSQTTEAAVGTAAEIMARAADLNGEVQGELVLPRPMRLCRWWPDSDNPKRVKFVVELSATESYFGSVILD